MTDKFTVVIIQSKGKSDNEIRKIINEFIKSVDA